MAAAYTAWGSDSDGSDESMSYGDAEPDSDSNSQMSDIVSTAVAEYGTSSEDEVEIHQHHSAIHNHPNAVPPAATILPASHTTAFYMSSDISSSDISTSSSDSDSDSELTSTDGDDHFSLISGYTSSSLEFDALTYTIPFMSLLPELRMNVYAQALSRSEAFVPIELSPSRRIKITHEAALLPSPDSWKRRRQPALLRSCRQIRDEALPIYYRTNTFNIGNTVISAGCLFPIYRYPTPDLAKPLRSIRHLRMLIRVMEKTTGGPAISGLEDKELVKRVAIDFDCEVSLRGERGIHLKVLHGRASKKAGKSITRSAVKATSLDAGHNAFLVDRVKSCLGEVNAQGTYDGFNLLRMGATLPGQLRCDETNGLQWWKLMAVTTVGKARVAAEWGSATPWLGSHAFVP